MSTTNKAFTVAEIAARYTELAKEGKWHEIQDEFFSDDAVSVEPEHLGRPVAKGREAITAKGKAWADSLVEVHSGYVGEPIVAGNHFAVTMGFDATYKEDGRMKMDEIALLEVKDGKIVKEQFVY